MLKYRAQLKKHPCRRTMEHPFIMHEQPKHMSLHRIWSRLSNTCCCTPPSTTHHHVQSAPDVPSIWVCHGWRVSTVINDILAFSRPYTPSFLHESATLWRGPKLDKTCGYAAGTGILVNPVAFLATYQKHVDSRTVPLAHMAACVLALLTRSGYSQRSTVNCCPAIVDRCYG